MPTRPDNPYLRPRRRDCLSRHRSTQTPPPHATFQEFAAHWELSGKAVGQLYVLHRLAPQAALWAVEQFRPPANPRNIDACFMAFTRTIAYSWHDEPERDTLIAQIKQIQSTGGEGKVRWQAY